MTRSVTIAAILLACTTACGPAVEDAPEQGAILHFITLGPQVSGLVAAVKKSRLTVCLSGVGGDAEAAWAANIRSSILKWIAPLRELTRDALVERVDVIRGAATCDTDVRVAQNVHSNTQIGSRPIVSMSPTGYFASYNVLLHEYGHAFALSDTYVGGRSGQCRAGQPQAVMCNTSFSELQADDISGVRAIYKRVFPNDTPPAGGTPPPNERNRPAEPEPEQAPAVALKAALGRAVATDRYELWLATTGSDRDAVSVSYCLDTAARCNASDAWIAATPGGERREARLYATPLPLDASATPRLTLRATKGSQSVVRELALARAD